MRREPIGSGRARAAVGLAQLAPRAPSSPAGRQVERRRRPVRRAHPDSTHPLATLCSSDSPNSATPLRSDPAAGCGAAVTRQGRPPPRPRSARVADGEQLKSRDGQRRRGEGRPRIDAAPTAKRSLLTPSEVTIARRSAAPASPRSSRSRRRRVALRLRLTPPRGATLATRRPRPWRPRGKPPHHRPAATCRATARSSLCDDL